MSAIFTPFSGTENKTGPDVSAVEKKLLQTDYADLIRSNPYKTFDYKETPWQNLLSSLGFRTSADAYRESMSLQSNEYINQVVQKAYNERYESPVAEAQRARVAGLNPDLQGLGDVAGASAMPSDQNPPVAPDSDEEKLAGVANFVMSCVTTGLGIASSLQSFRQASLAISQGEISVAGDLMDLSRKAAGILTPSEIDPDESRRSRYFDKASDWAASTMLPRGVRRKDANQFRRLVRQQFESMDFQRESYETGIKRGSARTEYARMLGSKFYNVHDTGLQIVNKNLFELSDEVKEWKAKNDWKQEIYRSDELDAHQTEALTRQTKALKEGQYWDLVDPVEQAGAFNEANKSSKGAAGVAAIINGKLHSMMSELSRSAQNGDFLSQCLMYAFALGELARVKF